MFSLLLGCISIALAYKRRLGLDDIRIDLAIDTSVADDADAYDVAGDNDEAVAAASVGGICAHRTGDSHSNTIAAYECDGDAGLHHQVRAKQPYLEQQQQPKQQVWPAGATPIHNPGSVADVLQQTGHGAAVAGVAIGAPVTRPRAVTDAAIAAASDATGRISGLINAHQLAAPISESTMVMLVV